MENKKLKLPNWLCIISSVSKSFFCRHRYDDFKIRNFTDPKMDDNGRLTTKMLIRTCGKCGKTEYIAT